MLEIISSIVLLAFVDSINPCALAVLTILLLSILTYNPKNKRKVLLAGLLFSLAVYITYFFYGYLIVNFFKLLYPIEFIKKYLYKALAIFAIILGILNIKEYFYYKPGEFLTEMPLKWRPKVKEILSKVTSPSGAFFVGIFVTIFLLPCTMGPYFIAGGILAKLESILYILLLLFYNLIFIFPMLLITSLVYLGYTVVERVSEWREENIRKLHAISGSIILVLGILLLLEIL